MASPVITWLKSAAYQYMGENNLDEVTPEVISHVIKVAGADKQLEASMAIKSLIEDGSKQY